MNPWVLIAAGAGAWLLLRRPASPSSSGGSSTDGDASPTPSHRDPKNKLNVCDTGKWTEADVRKAARSVQDFIELYAEPRPQGVSVDDWATDQAHLAAKHVFEERCPAFPVPDQRYQLEGHFQKYGEGYERLYDWVFSQTYSALATPHLI